jgi:hypothetical protein
MPLNTDGVVITDEEGPNPPVAENTYTPPAQPEVSNPPVEEEV